MFCINIGVCVFKTQIYTDFVVLFNYAEKFVCQPIWIILG